MNKKILLQLIFFIFFTKDILASSILGNHYEEIVDYGHLSPDIELELESYDESKSVYYIKALTKVCSDCNESVKWHSNFGRLSFVGDDSLVKWDLTGVRITKDTLIKGTLQDGKGFITSDVLFLENNDVSTPFLSISFPENYIANFGETITFKAPYSYKGDSAINFAWEIRDSNNKLVFTPKGDFLYNTSYAFEAPGNYTVKVTASTASSSVVKQASILIQGDSNANKLLTVSSTKGGRVTSNPARIDCRECSNNSNPYKKSFSKDSDVLLTANSDSGYRLAYWSGCPHPNGNQCRVTMDKNRTVSAVFSNSATVYDFEARDLRVLTKNYKRGDTIDVYVETRNNSPSITNYEIFVMYFADSSTGNSLWDNDGRTDLEILYAHNVNPDRDRGRDQRDIRIKLDNRFSQKGRLVICTDPDNKYFDGLDKDPSNDCSIPVPIEFIDKAIVGFTKNDTQVVTKKIEKNVDYNFTMSNIGNIASDDIPVNIYVSSDSNISVSDTFISTLNVPSIQAGQSSSQQNLSFRLTADLLKAVNATSSIWVGACIPDINNFKCTTGKRVNITSSLYIDTFKSVGSSNIKQGEPLPFTISVTNKAGGSSTNALPLKFWLSTDDQISNDDLLLKTLHVKSLRQSETYTFPSQTLAFSGKTGYFNIIMKLDDGIQEQEIIYPIRISNFDLSIEEISSELGREIHVKADTAVDFDVSISNDSSFAAPSSKLNCYLSESNVVSDKSTLVKTVDIPAIDSNREYELIINVTAKKGTFYFSCGIAAMGDSNLDNNYYTSSVLLIGEEELIVDAPTILTSFDGNSFDHSIDITITSNTKNAKIYYTLDSTTPTSSSTLYTASFKLDHTATLKAIAIAEGYETSPIAEASYVIVLPVVENISPSTTLINTDTTFSVKGKNLTDHLVFSLTGCSNVRPVAGGSASERLFICTLSASSGEKQGKITDSIGNVLKSFVVDATKPVASIPIISPDKGTFTGSVTVHLSSIIANAKIYYTLDGSMPDASSTLYNTLTPITLEQSVTIKAIVIAEGYRVSDVVEASFTVEIDLVISQNNAKQSDNGKVELSATYYFGDNQATIPSADMRYGFKYGLTAKVTKTAYVSSSPTRLPDNTSVAVLTLSDLERDKTYFYRSFVEINGKLVEGGVSKFVVDGQCDYKTWNVVVDKTNDYHDTILRLAYGNGILVATTDHALNYSHDNGITWHTGFSRKVGVAPDYFLSFWDIVWSSTEFYAIGIASNKTIIYKSNNGQQWEAIHTFSNSNRPSKLAWNGKQLAAVGSKGAVFLSDNGVSWQEYYVGSNEYLIDIKFINGSFEVISSVGTLFSSQDGKIWSISTVGINDNALGALLTGNKNNVVTYAANSPDRRIFTKLHNQSSWNATSDDYHLTDMIWDGKNYFAASFYGSLISSDGLSWQARPSISGKLLFDGEYVYVGSYQGMLQRSRCGAPDLNSGDQYEPNNTKDNANPIALNTSQTHSIDPANDEDWFTFTLTKSSSLRLETSGAAIHDTRLWLYDADLNKEVAKNDDGGVGRYSLINYTCSSPLKAGTYYVKVDEYNQDNIIPEYTLSLQDVQSCQSTPIINVDVSTPSTEVSSFFVTTITVTGQNLPDNMRILTEECLFSRGTEYDASKQQWTNTCSTAREGVYKGKITTVTTSNSSFVEKVLENYEFTLEFVKPIFGSITHTPSKITVNDNVTFTLSGEHLRTSSTLTIDGFEACSAIFSLTIPGSNITQLKYQCRAVEAGGKQGVVKLIKDLQQDFVVDVTATKADSDKDGIDDGNDNCPTIANSNQANFDGDNQGDVCDSDADNDGLPNTWEIENNLNPLDPNDAKGDLDKDGISNLDEFRNNTDPTKDSVKPVVITPTNIVLKSKQVKTKFALSSLGSATAIDAADGLLSAKLTKVNGKPPVFHNDQTTLLLKSGRHTLTWAATDTAGNTGEAEQRVDVLPRATFTINQASDEGEDVIVTVSLNGAAPTYPVVIPFTLSGSAEQGASLDYTLSSTDNKIIIAEPEARERPEGRLIVTLLDDGVAEETETIVLTMSESLTQATVGNKRIHQIKVLAENLPPKARIQVMQAGKKGKRVYQDNGIVTLTVKAKDPNNDPLSYVWGNTLTDLNTDNAPATLELDPLQLNAGMYEIAVTVSDGTHSIEVEKRIKVKTGMPVMPDVALDTDGDGINDIDERGDDNENGIADYLEDMNQGSHQLSMTGDNPLETTAGLSFELGDFAQNREDPSSSQISEDDLKNYLNSLGKPAYQADVSHTPTLLLDYVLNGLENVGESAQIVFSVSALTTDSVIRKYSVDNGWQAFTVTDDGKNSIESMISSDGNCLNDESVVYQTGLIENADCIRLTIEDGGANDADAKANGAIEDPVSVSTVTLSDVEQFVTGFYQQVLGRAPDADGFKHWVDGLNAGILKGPDLANNFIASAEFGNRNVNNDEFVTILYKAFFNRDPDSGGFNNWISRLERGDSHQQVLDGFLGAGEFFNLCDAYSISCTYTKVEQFVARFYQQILGRRHDAGGFKHWVDGLNAKTLTGSALANQFVKSGEFTNRQLNRSEFVTTLYRAFFNREPDSGGFNYWMSQLESGDSYQQVLNGFLGADEFSNLCKQYEIIPK